MPSSDLILNVRQIAGYPAAGASQGPTDSVLIQRGGLGGAYLEIDAETLVATSLQGDRPLQVDLGAPSDATGGQVIAYGLVQAFDGWRMWNGYRGAVGAQYLTTGPAAIDYYDPNLGWVWRSAISGAASAPISFTTRFSITPIGDATLSGGLTLGRNPLVPMEATPMSWVQAAIANSVTSFNSRTGDVQLWPSDIVWAGGATVNSPIFVGTPSAPTPAPSSNSTQLATTAFVNSAISGAGYAPLASPAFTGEPTAPTPPTTPTFDNSTRIATTQFVMAAVNSGSNLYAPLASPNFTGVPSAPTAAPGTSDGQLATTAFVQAAVSGSVTGVSSFNTRTGAVVLQAADITGAGGATVNSPIFTGTPQAPTAAPGTNTAQLATTAFVNSAISGAGYAPLASPAFTGVPTAPTPATGNISTDIATTAFVSAAISAVNVGVTTFNGRSGAVTLIANDISAVGGASLASPAFTGTPTAPTAAPGVSTTQLATTAFVMAAIAAGTGVTTFNGRSGAVTLVAADLTGAGGALLASPAFTGTPTAPTATPATLSNTQLATTAFVQAAIATLSIGVASFNTRTGAVTLTTSDVTAAGGAPAASPTFTGTVTIPTSHVTGNETVGGTITATGQIVGNASLAGWGTSGEGGSVISVQPGVNAAGFWLQNPSFAFGTVSAAGVPTAGYWSMDISNGNFNLTSGSGKGYQPGGGSWGATSDARVKEVIRDYDGGLGQIEALRPVVYRYLEETGYGEKPYVGLVAQEVETIMPEMVTVEDATIGSLHFDDMRRLDTTPLIFALVNAVKALAARVGQLETRMST